MVDKDSNSNSNTEPSRAPKRKETRCAFQRSRIAQSLQKKRLARNSTRVLRSGALLAPRGRSLANIADSAERDFGCVVHQFLAVTIATMRAKISFVGVLRKTVGLR
jgi:hypothetical protein